jgi:Tfp pilus assembly major pilin PilA
MTHQITPISDIGYVDKRRSYKNDFETRAVAGGVVFTANASGSTTTIVGANAAPGAGTNIMRLDDEFKLFNSSNVLKEETVFHVTAQAVAGSTTVTFTPAAAVATVSGDTIKLVGLANQYSTADMDRRLIALGFSAARVATLTENDKAYQIRVSDDPGSL